jgi:hypothetical protein
MNDVIEKPVEQPKVEVVNPVLKDEHVEQSKQFFRDQLAKAKEMPAEEKVVEQDVARMKPRKKESPQSESPPVAESKEVGEVDLSLSSSKPADAHTELPEDIFTPAAKKEEVKPSEAITEVDTMKLPEGAKPVEVASFSKLKEVSKSHIARLEEQLNDLRGKVNGNADVEALRTQLKESQGKYGELEERFGRELYTASPRFQSEFIEKEQSAILGAKAYLDGSPDVDAGIVDMLVALPPKKRAETLAERGVDQYAAGGILAELSRFDAVQRDKSKAIENWKTDTAQLIEQESAKQQEKDDRRVALENETWENTVKDLQDLWPLRKSKQEAWNQRGEKIVLNGKKIFNGGSWKFDQDGELVSATEREGLKTIGDLVLMGLSYRPAEKIIDQLTKKNKEQAEQISKLTASKPGGEMTQSVPSKTEDKQHEGMDRMESAKVIFNRFMQQAKGNG